MQIFLCIIVGYFLYSAFLVWRDFRGTSVVNAPLYVHKPSVGRLIFALLTRPFIVNDVYLFFPAPARMKFLGFVKLLIKVGILGFILHFIVGFFS